MVAHLHNKILEVKVKRLEAVCNRAYPPQQQKHAMNSIRNNNDFAVQEVVPVVMETACANCFWKWFRTK